MPDSEPGIYEAIGLAYAALPPDPRLRPWGVLVAEFGLQAAAELGFRQACSLGYRLELLIGLACPGLALGTQQREQVRQALRAAIGEHTTSELQAMLDGSALADFEAVVPALMRTGRACAQVAVNGFSNGTGFLVTDDLVLTAAHVVADLVGPDGTPRHNAGGRIAVTFPRPAEPPPGWPDRAFDAAPDWLQFWRAPHAPPREGPPPPEQLDCALIRLATPAPSAVPRVDILNPPDAAGTQQIQVLGFLGGTGRLVFDGASKLDDAVPPDGRVRHRAGAVAGVSGGPYLDFRGRVFGLHEGTWNSPEPHNRGVTLHAIRAAMRSAGTDPLLPARCGPLWYIQSPESCASWARAAGVAWDGVDPFHPVFGREAFQDWIARSLRPGPAAEPVVLVTGEPGSGKSFSAALLHASVPPLTDVVVVLPPELLRAGNVEAILARVGAAVGIPSASGPAVPYGTRPAAGLTRHDLLQFWLPILAARTETAPLRRVWIVADIGRPETWEIREVREFWEDLLKLVAAQNTWLRVVMAGLPQGSAGAMASQVDGIWLDPLPTVRWAEVWAVAQQATRSAAELQEMQQKAAWRDCLGSDPARLQLESVRYVRSLR